MSWVIAAMVPASAALTGVPAATAMSMPSRFPFWKSRMIEPLTGAVNRAEELALAQKYFLF